MGTGNLGALQMEQGKALAMRQGIADKGAADWPSARLHDRGAGPVEGLHVERLLRLADYIATLERMPFGRMEKKVAPASVVYGNTPCLGYTLDSAGAGLGYIQFSGQSAEEGSTAEGYWLSGYGLICWGWGMNGGIASVAAADKASALHHVLTAEPVRQGHVPGFRWGDVTPAHVADAIRHFVKSEDAARAWYMASGFKPVAEAGPGAEVPKPAPVAALTGGERWKALFLADRYGDMRALCDSQLADLEAERERLEAERVRVEAEQAKVDADLATWRKRKKAADALAAVDDAGTD